MYLSAEVIDQFPVAAKVAVIRHQLNQKFLERSTQIDALIALYVSRQHGLLLGPPGTGKSLLLDWICYAMGGEFFSALMTEYTKPEELFGSISIKALQEEDINRRNTRGMLPTVNVAYLDEIFKSNSAILNTLLQAVNERIFKNPYLEKIPLRCLVASSNELMDGVEALLDRFAYKSVVNYLGKEARMDFWKVGRKDKRKKEECLIRLNDGDVLEAEQVSEKIEIPYLLMDAIYEKLNTELHIEISDRKFAWLYQFLPALEWVRNPTATVVSIETINLYLTDCIWVNPDMAPKIQAVINTVVASWKTPESEAQEAVDAVTDRLQVLLESWGNKVDGDHAIHDQAIASVRTVIVAAAAKVEELLGEGDRPFQEVLDAKLERVNELQAFNRERIFDFHFRERGSAIAGIRHRLSGVNIPTVASSDREVEAYFSTVKTVLESIRFEQERIPTLPIRESDQTELLRLLEEVERHIPDPEDLFADDPDLEIVEVA